MMKRRRRRETKKRQKNKKLELKEREVNKDTAFANYEREAEEDGKSE